MPASRKSRLFTYLLVLGMIATFIVVALRTFEIRLEIQEGYPPASTYRADAQGCRALYESLQRVPGVQVTRFLRAFTSLPSPQGRSLVIAGINPVADSLPVRDRKLLSSWVEAGGTLIVALESPANPTASPGSTDYELGGSSPPSPNGKSAPRTEEFWFETLRNSGVRVFRHPDRSARHRFESAVFKTSGSWLGPIYFRDLESPWRVAAQADHLPVVVERSFGQGNIKLIADSYLLTNGALAANRNTGFLSWLFRKQTTILFDESHFGITENPGVASLARRYGLEPAFFVLLIIALLFVWANRYSLTPVQKIRQNRIVPGQGGEAVLINLLRRSLPGKDLLATCIDLCRKGGHDPASAKKLDQWVAELDPRIPLTDQYNQLTQRLNRRK
jgi:Domain of unknown function (DUF4350)